MEGSAQILVSNVGQLVGKEFRQLRGVGGEVARLRDELSTINALLRMHSEADEGAVDHFVREWMKQLREVAYDAQDCVDLYLFRVRCRPGDRFFVWSKRLFATLLSRRRLAGDIRALRAHAAAVNEQHALYGVSLQLPRRTSSLPPVAASSVALRRADDPNQFVGITEQATSLAQKLRPASDRKLQVFSIVGFGGLGKTTLAMEVCRLLEPDFDRQAQVAVSQAFDGRKDMHVQGLLKRVLQQIVQVKVDPLANGHDQDFSLAGIDNMEVDQLAQKLEEALKNKRYLVVIDDVWTDAAWEVIHSKLPENDCGSRIIITTRIESVAKVCYSSSDNIHHIKPLTKENSKKLFLIRAFGSMDASCPPELEEAMQKVLKKCGGLPLAIITIASLLSSYGTPENKHMWETIFKSIGSQMEGHPSLEGMRQIITLSYDHLPHHLKGCMMYLSIFPEDYVISKVRLLRRWIAEGLVAEKRGLTPMEVAESYFDELVNRSMIDRAVDMIDYYDGREETCHVHDMMLEVIVSKSLDANFVSLIGGQYDEVLYDKVRRLSIHGGVDASEDPPSKKTAAGHGRPHDIKGLNVQHVRSLSMFESKGHHLLNHIGEFPLLRVLDLEDLKGLENKHMGHICRMYLLRFLNLKGTDITELPSEVGNLEHLQTLDVRHTFLKGLPTSVTELEKLESLQFSNKEDYWEFQWEAPKGLRKMKALRKLHNLTVRSTRIEVIEEIGELEQLEELYISVHQSIPEDAQIKLNQSISGLYSLRRLNIQIYFNTRCQSNFLHQLNSPPRHLTYLRLCGTLEGDTQGTRGGCILAEWVRLLTNLVEFAIAHAHIHGDTLFDVLCQLPNLTMLTVEDYFYDGTEIVARTNQAFPALRELRILATVGITEVYRFDEGSMPELETLVVKFSQQQKRIVGIEHLKKLKEVQFTGPTDSWSMKQELDMLREENVRRERSGSTPLTVKVRYE